MNKKIGFITAHKHPSVDSTLQVLEKLYPENEIVIFKIVNIFFKYKMFVLKNLYYTFKENGSGILTGRKKLSNSFFRTTYIFKKVREIIPEMIRKGDYMFTFQIGSAFDTSTPGIPHFLYTDHTHLENLTYPGYSKKDLYSKKWIELEHSVYKNATLNFVRSSNILRSVIEDYKCPAEKVSLVFAGNNAPAVDMGKINNKKYSSKNILFVGTSWDIKGGPELIKAFEKVREVEPAATLTLVGGGAPENLSVKNCIIIGKVNLKELEQYYLNAAVFCLPSRGERFGIVYLEAMHYKLPIVATPNGAIPDFVKHNESGYLVPNGDIDSLAEALLSLINDPEKAKKFGEVGYQIANRDYTWEKVGEKIGAAITTSLQNYSKVETGETNRHDNLDGQVITSVAS